MQGYCNLKSLEQKMKFILFIGQHKVGSTSLQTYMSLNSERLLKRGILYPNVVRADLRDKAKLWSARKLGVGPVPLIYREPHNALVQQMLAEKDGRDPPPWFKNVPSAQEMFATIRSEISFYSPNIVFLCAESFSNFSEYDEEPLNWIGDLLNGCEVEIHCTLRRPDDYISSWHLQRLKFGNCIKPLCDGGLQEYLGTFHLDYQRMITPWQETFPQAKFSVVNYSEVMGKGGSIPSFWRQSNLEEPNGFKSVRRGNPSIHPAISEVVRLANCVLKPKDRQIFWRWIADRSKRFDLPPSKDVELLGQASRQTIFEAFQSSLDYISGEFGPDPFFPDFDGILKSRPIPERAALADALPAIEKAVATSSLSEQIKSCIEDITIKLSR